MIFSFLSLISPSYNQGCLTEVEGRLSTVDLLVLTSLDQLIFKLEILFSFLTKQAILMRRSTVLSFPPQLVFPAIRYIVS